MAMQLIFTCKGCGFEVEAWDEGNPYILMPNGKRRHFYHPGEPGMIEDYCEEILGHLPAWQEQEQILKERAGNEPNHICLDCKRTTKLDPRVDKMVCEKCGGIRVVNTYELEGHPCPRCGEKFGEGALGAIS